MRAKQPPNIWPSLVHAMALGPILSIVAAPLFGVALFQLVTSDRGLETDGLLALVIAPVATVCVAPLAKRWLRHQFGGYWGAVASGGIWGAIWATAIWAVLSITGHGDKGSIGSLIFGGFPIGVAYAAVFWTSLTYRSTNRTEQPNFFKSKLIFLVGLTLPIIWLPQFFYPIFAIALSL